MNASEGTDATGVFGQINKYDGLSGFDGISFQVASNNGQYQFTNPRPDVVQLANVTSNSVNQTFENIFLNLGRNDSTLWNNYDLPTSYNFAAFDQTKNMSVGFSGGSFSMGITTLNAVNVSQVPEPASLGTLALGGALLLRRRKA